MDSDSSEAEPTVNPAKIRKPRLRPKIGPIAKISGNNNKKSPRTGFNIKKDITLLRSVLTHNPYQLGNELWESVLLDFKAKYPNHASSTTRTLLNRVELLIDKYQSQQFKTKTGTEEERTERGSILEEIIGLKAEEEAIIKVIDEDTASVNENILFTQDELNRAVHDKKPSRKAEKERADEERDLINEDFHTKRAKKRTKMNFEENLIKQRQEHEMLMEEKKLKLEEDRIELERQKEARLAEENRRRDEMQSSQLGIQKMMLEMFQKLVEK